MIVINFNSYFVMAANRVIKESSYDQRFCDVIEDMFFGKSLLFKKKILDTCLNIISKEKRVAL